MAKKILALMLTLMFALALTLDLSSTAAAKTPEEKQAAKEAKLQKKRDKALLKVQRKDNIKKLMEWAEGGDVQAQLILSYAYATKQRVPKKNRKVLAVEWRNKAAEANEELAANFLPIEFYKKEAPLERLFGLSACRSLIGDYVEQNFDDAVRWGLLGESEYDELSMAVVGAAYYTGRGFNQDYKKAVEYFKRAGEEPIALYHLSDAYLNGNGVDQDLKKAKFYSDYMNLVSKAKIDKYRAKMQRKKDKKDAREERKAEEAASRKSSPPPKEEQPTPTDQKVDEPTDDQPTDQKVDEPIEQKVDEPIEQKEAQPNVYTPPPDDPGTEVPYPFYNDDGQVN